MTPQYLQGLTYMGHMSLQITTVHQDIIQKYNGKVIQLLPKNAVHKMHKSRWSVGETER